MKQYTRVYISNGVAEHVYTQDTPLTIEPINPEGYEVIDLEIDHDEPAHVHAREIRENFEVSGKEFKPKESAINRVKGFRITPTLEKV